VRRLPVRIVSQILLLEMVYFLTQDHSGSTDLPNGYARFVTRIISEGVWVKKRGPKKKPVIKDAFLVLRTFKSTASRVKALADIYASGNINKWLEHAAVNAPRRFLK